MKESLGMNDFSQSSSQVSLPESLEISADVTDFTMSLYLYGRIVRYFGRFECERNR